MSNDDIKHFKENQGKKFAQAMKLPLAELTAEELHKIGVGLFGNSWGSQRAFAEALRWPVSTLCDRLKGRRPIKGHHALTVEAVVRQFL